MNITNAHTGKSQLFFLFFRPTISANVSAQGDVRPQVFSSTSHQSNHRGFLSAAQLRSDSHLWAFNLSDELVEAEVKALAEGKNFSPPSSSLAILAFLIVLLKLLHGL